MIEQSDRRRFRRIQFDKEATLIFKDQRIACTILDICLKGALVNTDSNVDIPDQHSGQLIISLDDQEQQITMTVKLTHRSQQQFGLQCVEIDLDSISHLRRLVELNANGDELLDREFAALLAG